MSRRPATFTQADVARALRAAIHAGAAGVEVRSDGTLFIHTVMPVNGEAVPLSPEKPLERRPRPVL